MKEHTVEKQKNNTFPSQWVTRRHVMRLPASELRLRTLFCFLRSFFSVFRRCPVFLLFSAACGRAPDGAGVAAEFFGTGRIPLAENKETLKSGALLLCRPMKHSIWRQKERAQQIFCYLFIYVDNVRPCRMRARSGLMVCHAGAAAAAACVRRALFSRSVPLRDARKRERRPA